MSFLTDVRDWVAEEISHLGLGVNSSTEVSGGGYSHIAVTYTDGVLDGTPLEFSGPPGTTITHVLFKRAGTTWVARPVSPQQFDTNGKLHLMASEVSTAFPVS